MLRQYIRINDYPYPFHQPGEVVLASYGNFLEARERCSKKLRPVILLKTSQGQHLFAGLTTKPRYITSGERRPVLPKPACLGLDEKLSHLWSSRPAFVCRLDVRKHLGWIDKTVVLFLAQHMKIDSITVSILWNAARDLGDGPPRQPR